MSDKTVSVNGSVNGSRLVWHRLKIADSQPHPRRQSLLSQEWVKLRTSQDRSSIRTKAY